MWTRCEENDSFTSGPVCLAQCDSLSTVTDTKAWVSSHKSKKDKVLFEISSIAELDGITLLIGVNGATVLATEQMVTMESDDFVL